MQKTGVEHVSRAIGQHTTLPHRFRKRTHTPVLLPLVAKGRALGYDGAVEHGILSTTPGLKLSELSWFSCLIAAIAT